MIPLSMIHPAFIHPALAPINDSLAALAPSLANHLWQSTAFALAAWLLTLLLRSNAARVRYAVWLAASLKFLLPFSLLVSLGALLPRPQRTMVAAPIDVAVDTVALPFSGADIAPAPIPAGPSLTQLVLRALPEILAALWLNGALVVLAVWLARWRQVALTRHRALPAHTGRELDILNRLCAHSAPPAAPVPLLPAIPLLLSPELMEPGIVGILRPALLWPTRLSARLDDKHIEAILAHELMHVRRRDNLAAALHMLVETLFWFHPLVWFIERRMVEERERACDQAVVQLGSAPGIYADSLLKACRFCVESPLACVSGITGADLNRRVRSIMTLRLARLTLPRKLLLAVLAIAAIAAPVAFGVIHAPVRLQAAAQSPTGDKVPTFDVVSIKPSRQGELRVQDMPEEMPDGIRTRVNTVLDLIRAAYGPAKFPVNDRILGAPDWASQEAFDIQAKVAGPDVPTFQKLSFDQRRPMLQALLADRFKLKLHRETRPLPIYELVVGKSGPRLKEARPDDARPDGLKDIHGQPLKFGFIKFVHPTEAVAQAMPIASLANTLSQPWLGLGRPVVDKTGLTGTYDFTLKWTPDQIAIGAPPADDSGPSIFTAIQEQLGLKLVPATGPVEVLVIDHIEKPSLDGAASSSEAAPISPGPTPVPHPSLTPVAFAQASPATAAPRLSPPNQTATNAAIGGTIEAELYVQLPLAQRDYRFEVASIRPGPPDGRLNHMPGPKYTPGSFRSEVETIGSLAAQAFGKRQGFELVSPRWANATYFAIDATIPDGATKEDLPVMIQHLLEDRFALKYHHETRQMAGYELVVAKPDPRLAKSAAADYDGATLRGTSGFDIKNGVPRFDQNAGSIDMCFTYDRGAACALHGRNRTMQTLATDLARRMFAPVKDATGLQGGYDYTVIFTPEPVSAPGVVVSPGGGVPVTTLPEGPLDYPLLRDALPEQLGLKLQPVKNVPVDVVIIDNANKQPTEN